MAAAPDYEESLENFTESEYSVEDDISKEYSESAFDERSDSSWTARLSYVDHERKTPSVKY